MLSDLDEARVEHVAEAFWNGAPTYAGLRWSMLDFDTKEIIRRRTRNALKALKSFRRKASVSGEGVSK